jgi:hypothetical protein
VHLLVLLPRVHAAHQQVLELELLVAASPQLALAAETGFGLRLLAQLTVEHALVLSFVEALHPRLHIWLHVVHPLIVELQVVHGRLSPHRVRLARGVLHAHHLRLEGVVPLVGVELRLAALGVWYSRHRHHTSYVLALLELLLHLLVRLRALV